ncbi:DUF4230 domain-containing protein [Actinomadura logoneensis]|uniref:DUF4230 domain-containing protein n=1 Tax=Actinomadura logoneensis TaxID=2293572 RepID=A0A372JAL0_9ACTN|nr:DUF4230 domain-containing protein [Actinomadura logoneensis]RFU37065.1 DUF4230 domain-containing protein [Actinomadura logoneensis]
MKPAPPQETPAPARRERRWGRLGVPLLLVAATVAIVLVVQNGLHMLPHWLNPFAEDTKDRSGPALLRSVRDMHRYQAASGDFQVVVDLDKEAKYLPGSLRGRRTLFIGQGSVNAYVDFSRLGSGAITVNSDRTAATVRLPHAQLDSTNLDPKRSYVFSTQRGLFDRFGDFFSSNPNDQQQLYVLASQKIQTAAQQSGLQTRADQNTRTMLENMLRALGFKTVTIQQASQ